MNPSPQLLAELSDEQLDPKKWREWPAPAKLRLLSRINARKRAKREGCGRELKDIERRRRFVGHPAKYARDVLGRTYSPQQETMAEAALTHNKALFPSGNNVGKTDFLSTWAVYKFDAVGALPGLGYEEQGGIILLPGPDDATIFATIYKDMLGHIARAISRGWKMPGVWSDRSVLAHARMNWFVESFSPPRRVDQNVRHTASGRHHPNMTALIEEGQGVDDATWRAVEGMCSALGNQILSAYNPTEAVGPASTREENGAYYVVRFSAFDHPNVIERREVIPGAISPIVIDERVRSECRDHGSYPEQQPDVNEGDFLYALPELGAEEVGPRADGVLGHPSAEIHVFRPGGFFDPQVRGLRPRSLSNALCDPADWDAAVARWKADKDPQAPPDRLGVDPARSPEGDDPCMVPTWGEDAEALLRKYKTLPVALTHAQKLERIKRARSGSPIILMKGDGPEVAEQVRARFPDAPACVDEGGVGVSVLDHGRKVLQQKGWAGVSNAARPEWMDKPLPGEPFYENIRAITYARVGMLVRLGLVDVPDDVELKKEFLAHYLIVKYRIVETHDAKRGLIKERKISLLLCPKDEIKKKVGHSPDRADAWVLSLYSGGPKMEISYTTPKRAVGDEGRSYGRFRRGAW